MKYLILIGCILVAAAGMSQEYPTVKIGSQIWMAENSTLAFGRFETVVVDSSLMVKQYVYDWESALNACPDGYRLPTDADWDSLVSFSGGFKTAGTSLKKNLPNHFNATLAGNFLLSVGFFNYVGDYGYYWCADEFNKKSAWARVFGNHQTNVIRTTIPKQFYLSVRCIKTTE